MGVCYDPEYIKKTTLHIILRRRYYHDDFGNTTLLFYAKSRRGIRTIFV